MDHIVVDEADGVATVILNRPEVRNATDREMICELTQIVGRVDADSAIRCLVLRGAGAHFSGGGDVTSFAHAISMAPATRREEFRERLLASIPLFEGLDTLSKPFVVVARGAVAGAGLSLLLAADVALVSDTAFFVFAHARLGIALDAGLSYHLPRAVGIRRARELALLGTRLKADEALTAGLIARIIPDGELDEAADKVIQRLATGPTAALARSRRLISMSFDNDIATQMEAEANAVAECAAGADFVEGIRAFLESRQPGFDGR